MSSSGGILIVDDDSDVRAALSELLEAEGFSVEGVPDGWDFRNEQMRDPQLAAVPVVIVSASGFSRDSIQSQFRPAAFVEKPIERAALLGVLRELVGSRAPAHLDVAEGTGETKGEPT
jgi:CheY-like chemotaxis protein